MIACLSTLQYAGLLKHQKDTTEMPCFLHFQSSQLHIMEVPILGGMKYLAS